MAYREHWMCILEWWSGVKTGEVGLVEILEAFNMQ